MDGQDGEENGKERNKGSTHICLSGCPLSVVFISRICAVYLFKLCFRVDVHITDFTVKRFVLQTCVSLINWSFAFHACPRKGFDSPASIPSF